MFTFINSNQIFTYLLSCQSLPNHTLLASSFQGFWCVLGLFLFCFLGVHLLILATMGWKQRPKLIQSIHKTIEKSPSSQEEKKENKAPTQNTAQEPIYYIVERKTKHVKPGYGKPKQIRFK